MKTLLVALNAHYMHTNLAIRQMKAAAGKAEGARVELCEMHINLPYRRALETIAREKPDAVGFSCYIWNIAYALRLGRALRLALPECAIFLGGPEVAWEPEKTMEDNPWVDGVLSGEGETVFPPFLKALAAGEAICGLPGVTARDGAGRILRTAPPPPMPPEDWPDPYEDGLAGLENRILYIETSRGCPYACQYCLSSVEEKVRALGAEESIRRLTRLAEGGVKLIKLVDRTFNFDRERAKAIWRGLKEHALSRGLSPTYHFEIAANLVDGETISLLGDAPDGLFQFEAGVQTSSDEVLKNVGRNVPFAPVREAVKALRRAGNIHLHTDLIAGLPGEDMARFARSFDETFDLGADMLQLGFLKLLKGSGLRKNAEKLGIVYEPDAPYEVISTREMSFEELCFLKDVEEALEWYHNSGRYKTALRLLLDKKRPFELFSFLARALRRVGALDAERGEKARAQALWDAGAELASPDRLGDLIRHDLLLAGRRQFLPEGLRFEESDQERALLRARFHPVRGQSAFTYDFDPEAYRRSGLWREGRYTLLYDGAGGAEAAEKSGNG